MYNNKFQEKQVKHVQNRVVFFYTLTCFLVIIGSLISLHSGWKHHISMVGTEMRRNNLVYQNLIGSTISDSLRLLQIANKKINSSDTNQLQNREQLQTILTESREAFAIFNQDRFGLLLVTDADGALIARSDGPVSKPTNFSDRFWFQQVKEHPNNNFTIGPLLIARTTGRPVSHVSQAIKNKNGQLVGVIAIQIESDKIQTLIEDVMLEGAKSQRKILNQSGEIVWSQPIMESINSDHGVKCTSPDCLLRPNSNGWAVADKKLVSHTSIAEMGVHTISTQALQDVRKDFMHDNLSLILYGILTFIPFSFLVRRFYLQIGELELVRIISNTDTLTGINNRLAFDKEYEKILGDARRNKRPLSILFIDIDNFKNCNDTYGHDNGDIVLKSVANTISGTMKRPLDLCARWGGEEFVVVLADTHQEGAIKVAEDILSNVRETSISIKDYAPISVTVSIGISTISTKTSFSGNLIDDADQAMYRAKKAGRDRYSI